MPMSEEQKKAAGERLQAGKARAKAEREAKARAEADAALPVSGVEIDLAPDTTPEEPPSDAPMAPDISVDVPIAQPKGLKKLGRRRGGKTNAVLRGRKMVQPACMVVDERGQPTTGPCQQAISGVSDQWAANWFLHCDHGDEAIPQKDRPYYEVSYEFRETEEYLPDENGDLVATGKVERKKIKHLKPRYTQVAVGKGSMSGQQYTYAVERGFRPLSDFNTAPMCDYWNCWSQDVQRFQNGIFCSDMHARLIKAVETGVVLAIPWEGMSAERRDQQLASLSV
jgi:hypothetical protein